MSAVNSSDPLFVQIRAFVSMATYVAVPVGYYTFLIWQIFDAKKQCRKFNLHMDEVGAQFWEVTKQWKIVYRLGLISPILAVAVFFIGMYFVNTLSNLFYNLFG